MWKALLVMLGLVLCVATVRSAQPERPRPQEKLQPAVTIRGRQFSPSRLTIKRGQTVIWTNNDDLDHAIEANDGSFESGTLKKRGSFQATFKKAGKYPYACKFHPREKGMIVVE